VFASPQALSLPKSNERLLLPATKSSVKSHRRSPAMTARLAGLNPRRRPRQSCLLGVNGRGAINNTWMRTARRLLLFVVVVVVRLARLFVVASSSSSLLFRPSSSAWKDTVILLYPTQQDHKKVPPASSTSATASAPSKKRNWIDRVKSFVPAESGRLVCFVLFVLLSGRYSLL
jgi:hypothetical protein